jgi:hypothetical protein
MRIIVSAIIGVLLLFIPAAYGQLKLPGLGLPPPPPENMPGYGLEPKNFTQSDLELRESIKQEIRLQDNLTMQLIDELSYDHFVKLMAVSWILDLPLEESSRIFTDLIRELPDEQFQKYNQIIDYANRLENVARI